VAVDQSKNKGVLAEAVFGAESLCSGTKCPAGFFAEQVTCRATSACFFARPQAFKASALDARSMWGSHTDARTGEWLLKQPRGAVGGDDGTGPISSSFEKVTRSGDLVRERKPRVDLSEIFFPPIKRRRAGFSVVGSGSGDGESRLSVASRSRSDATLEREVFWLLLRYALGGAAAPGAVKVKVGEEWGDTGCAAVLSSDHHVTRLSSPSMAANSDDVRAERCSMALSAWALRQGFGHFSTPLVMEPSEAGENIQSKIYSRK
jgi:hypothetical protein